jgi:hypothetical protein
VCVHDLNGLRVRDDPVLRVAVVRRDDLEHVFVRSVVAEAEHKVRAAARVVVFDDVVDDRALSHAFLADDDGRLAERDAHREVREHLLQVVLQLLSLQHPPRQGYNLQR